MNLASVPSEEMNRENFLNLTWSAPGKDGSFFDGNLTRGLFRSLLRYHMSKMLLLPLFASLSVSLGVYKGGNRGLCQERGTISGHTYFTNSCLHCGFLCRFLAFRDSPR